MISAAVINKLRIGAIALTAGLGLSMTTMAQAHSGGGHGADARFGYGGFGYYGGFGILGYGLFFDALPLHYSTLWWGGTPYYYANDNYYQWNGAVSLYETVRPPRDLASQVGTAQAPENFNFFDFNLLRIPRLRRRPIASNVSTGPRIKPESVLHREIARQRSQPLPLDGRIFLELNRLTWRAAATA